MTTVQEGIDRLRVPADRVAAELFDGEAIVIDLATGAYHSLAGPASDVWVLVAARTPITEIAPALAERWHIDPDVASRDVGALLDALVDAGLAEPCPADDPALPAELAPLGNPAYETAELVTYTDMQEMLALDPPMPGLSGMPWEGGGN